MLENYFKKNDCSNQKSIFKIIGHSNGPVISQSNPAAKDIKYGFEGGRAIKINDSYYIYTTEIIANPFWTKTRLGLWESKNMIDWQRICTLFESTGDFSGEDPKAALWSPMPTYDYKTEKWYLSYVAYRSKPNTDTAWNRNYMGRIHMAVSEKPGYYGFDGPFRDTLTVLQPGAESAPWEGSMGTNSFFPFPVTGSWVAFYGSSTEVVGLAVSNRLTGPWKRMSNREPLEKNLENPVVSRLSDGRFIALFDGCGENRKIGYMVSADGISWSEKVFFNLENEIAPWWGLLRTPLGLVHECDNIFTIFFTAYNKDLYTIPNVWKTNNDDVFKGYFADIAWFKVQLVK